MVLFFRFSADRSDTYDNRIVVIVGVLSSLVIQRQLKHIYLA